ncbi:hypothetical protein Acr_19g0011230 [Actinidia rufa]|uniref:Uncharacterized protein n=1 Tax=Actinidia rufa TaxID=165716 RepID=A0A7J0GBJ8_9ERIC|nr:hypothetical protein Acr_19g0011230 [Actinidia rufa]
MCFPLEGAGVGLGGLMFRNKGRGVGNCIQVQPREVSLEDLEEGVMRLCAAIEAKKECQCGPKKHQKVDQGEKQKRGTWMGLENSVPVRDGDGVINLIPAGDRGEEGKGMHIDNGDRDKI